VTTAGQTVGDIYFNSAFTYTLGGSGLTLTPGAGIFVEAGNHIQGGVLTLPGDTPIVFAPATSLRLGHIDGSSAALTAEGDGTLIIEAFPDTLQSLTLAIQELVLDFNYALNLPISLSRMLSLRPSDSRTVTLNGAISGSGGLTKSGSSFLIPTAANTYAGPTAVNAGTLRVASLANGGAASGVGASSAAPGNLVIGAGTLHITGPATTDRGYTLRTVDTTRAAVLRVDDEVTFGGQILADSGAFVKTGPGTVTYTYPGANQLNRHQLGGANSVQNIGAYGDSPTTGFTGFTVSQGKIVLGVPGQTNSAVRIEIGSRTTTAAGQETAGEVVLNNGVLNSSDTVSIGRNNGTTTTAGPTGLSSRLTVNGGICNFPILATGNNGAGLSGYNARPVIEVNGGQVNVSGSYLSVGESAGASASVFVSGGTVNIYNANCDLRIGGGQGAPDNSGSGTVSRKEFWFNGGVFLPHTAGQTMSGLTAAYVSTNGAAIDTSLADYTVAQNLLHAPALGAAKDGGLVKLSTNTLSLTGAANTFDGPIRVAEGLLRARLGGTNSLFVAAGAAFDALGETCTVGDLTGNGLLTNGVIRVAGRLDAGTNGAPAGASMTVRNLSFAGGSTFACDWATNALGQVVNDTGAVTGTLAPEAPGFFDLGRDESDPITLPFQLTLMTYGTFSGSFHGWKAVNTGLPANTRYATVATAVNGTVTLEVRYSGTMILVK
jgi:fibronectin-binding autotransporter adhesin